jgi:hypothetical protein
VLMSHVLSREKREQVIALVLAWVVITAHRVGDRVRPYYFSSSSRSWEMESNSSSASRMSSFSFRTV